MLTGLRLYATNIAPASSPAFDPATLSLTGWWRGSYGGSPWAGTASAGSSGSRSLVQNTLPAPSVGTAVNGYTPADFDGSTQRLQHLAGDMSTLISAGAYFWWALFYARSNGGATGAINAGNHLNPAIWSEGAAWAGCSIRSDAGTSKVQVWHASGGVWVGNEHVVTLNAWNLICCRYDGANIRSRFNSGAVVVSPSVGAVGSLANPINVGTNYDSGAKFNGQLLGLSFKNTAESDARFDDIKAYVNARYALSL